MRKRLTVGVVALAMTAFTGSTASADPLVVTPNTSAADLVAALLAGSGLTVVPGSEVLVGGALNSAGTFTGGAGIIPFDSGVILTSGLATDAEGPNNSDSTTVNSGGVSDPDLEPLNGTGTVLNATTLQFSFTAPNDVISFQYVFGSEEYNEFVGSGFNDVFGFFLNGTNIATLPGAGGVVSINNDNSTPAGQGDPACVAAGKPDANLNVEYDGLVGASANPVFWLFATGNLLPGVNTIKLAIGDTNDTQLDSGVFLKAIINAPPPPPVAEPASLALLGIALAGAGARRLRNRKTA